MSARPVSVMRNFRHLIESQWSKGNFVCVGLDSDLNRIPKHVHLGKNVEATLLAFNIAIVNATYDLACAYKPNLAFYLAHGSVGLNALRDTVEYINRTAPNVPVILDAKIADIGNTSRQYAKFVFEELGTDAVTVSPYLGKEALEPFLAHKNKGIFVLCKTSNPGSGEFQDRTVMLRYDETETIPANTDLYRFVARRVAGDWNTHRNCGLVAGATYPEELAFIRKTAGDLPLLIPGIGHQGGNFERAIKNGIDSKGRGIIINSSSGIIFASSGRSFAKDARSRLSVLRNRAEACVESYAAKAKRS